MPKLFGILSYPYLEIKQSKWKFWEDGRIFCVWGIPRSKTLLENRFGDYPPSPYGEYREREWVEISHTYRHSQADSKRPLHDLISIRKAIEQKGDFTWEIRDSGLRVIGYTW